MGKSISQFSEIILAISNVLPRLNTAQLEELGLTHETAERLSLTSPKELHHLADRAHSFMSVRFDNVRLNSLLDDLTRLSAEREIEDQFLMQSATSAMMREYFGMHTTEFCARRRMLGLAGQGQHRPQYCDEATEVRIWEQWEKHVHLDERMRFLAVSEATGVPLNIVCPAIKRHMP